MNVLKVFTCRVAQLRWGPWYIHDDPTWPMPIRLRMWAQNVKSCLGWLVGDVLLGCERFSRSAVTVEDAVLELPEDQYPLRITLSVMTGRRPRWPWVTKRDNYTRIDVLAEGGIPLPEGNHWGRPSLSSLILWAATADEAIEALRETVLLARQTAKD